MITDMNFDTTQVDRSLGDVEVRGRRLLPAFRELRKPLRKDQRDHARAQEGPSGAWPPRSPVTEARRLARNRGARVTKAMKLVAPRKFKRRSTPKKILGRLPTAVFATVGELFVRVTSRAPWSDAHQQGGIVGRGSKLPQRTFLWLSRQIIETARATIGSFIVKGWDQ